MVLPAMRSIVRSGAFAPPHHEGSGAIERAALPPDLPVGLIFRNRVKPLSQKYSSSVFRKTVVVLPSARLAMRDVSADRHEREAGCDGRVGAAGRAARDADGEVAWSWRPDAGVKPEVMILRRRRLTSPVLRGERV